MGPDKNLERIALGQRAMLVRDESFGFIETLEKRAIQELKAAYRAHKRDELPDYVAKLVALEDLKEQILSQIRGAERAKKELR